jgi:hypothetical protein
MTDGENVIGLDAAIEAAEERKASEPTRAVHISWAKGSDGIDVRSDGVITEIHLWAAARLLQSLGDELFWQRRAKQQEDAQRTGIIVPATGTVKGKPS